MFFTKQNSRYTLIIIAFLLTSCLSNSAKDEAVILAMENRPNIIFILADDLDQKLGTINYMVNLKEYLYDYGTEIENFLVTTPMCCPSRVNILRGQFTHNHQVFNNEAPHGGFPKFFETGEEASTLATWLQAAGYRTALIGKYMNAYPLAENRVYVPPGWSEWYSPGRKNAYDGYDYYLNENGELIPYPPSQENYFTDVLSRKSVDFIKRAKQDQVPFFLFLSSFAPHEPAVPATRHLELFPTIQAPRTPSFNEEDVSDKPLNLQGNPLLTEEQILRIDKIYRNRVLSMLAVDELIPEIIQVLEDTGQLDNTYIVFTSDQGFRLGQHRVLQAKSSFYEEDIIVPFVVRGPNIPEGKTISGLLAGTIDIAPTFAEWGGIIPPTFVDGVSFATLLTGAEPQQNSRNAFLLETYAFSEEENSMQNNSLFSFDYIFSHLSFLQTNTLPKWSGLRSLEYTYIKHPDGFIELYDLKNDPYQLQNISAETAPQILAFFENYLSSLETCTGKECSELDSLPITIP